MLALDLIRGFEGCRLRSYQDQKGVWTCGWGSTGPDVGANTVFTQEQADARLEHVVSAVAAAVQSLVTVPLTDNQEAALISFAYNVGTHALADSTLLKLLNAGNEVAASNQFLAWDHVDGQVDQGLLNRRQIEKAIFLKDAQEPATAASSGSA